MAVPFSENTTREQIEAELSLDTGADGITGSDAVTHEPGTSDSDFNENGKFATGNRVSVGNTRARGIVALIKERSNNYEELIGLLLDVAKGNKIDGQKPNLKDRMDATNSLLDRAIGKPTQQIIASVDDETKQLMADRLRLRVLEAESKQATVIDSEPVTRKEVTSLQQMRDRDVG